MSIYKLDTKLISEKRQFSEIN